MEPKIRVLNAQHPWNGELQILALAEMDSEILMDPFPLGMLCDGCVPSVLQQCLWGFLLMLLAGCGPEHWQHRAELGRAWQEVSGASEERWVSQSLAVLRCSWSLPCFPHLFTHGTAGSHLW